MTDNPFPDNADYATNDYWVYMYVPMLFTDLLMQDIVNLSTTHTAIIGSALQV